MYYYIHGADKCIVYTHIFYHQTKSINYPWQNMLKSSRDQSCGDVKVSKALQSLTLVIHSSHPNAFEETYLALFVHFILSVWQLDFFLAFECVSSEKLERLLLIDMVEKLVVQAFLWSFHPVRNIVRTHLKYLSGREHKAH